MPALRDVLDLIEQWYPAQWAEDWDAPGLVCGDPDQPVERILLAVDPVLEVAEEATAYAADLLVVHHPLYLRGTTSVAATSPKGRVLHRLVTHGCALLTAHTNADSPAYGVSEAIAQALGLEELRPLEPDPGAPERGSGRIGVLREPVTLRAFAELVRERLRPSAHGVRVAGPADQAVRTVALCGGIGRLPARRGAGRGRRRLPDLRPAPPPRERGPRARHHGSGRHRALVGGVDLAAGPAPAPGRRAGRYGGGPREHRAHRPLDVPGVSL